MSQSIHTTVDPIRVAFSELVNVTVSALDSISSTTEPSVLPEPIQDANLIENDDDSELFERSGSISTMNENGNSQSRFDNVHHQDHLLAHSMNQPQPIHHLSSNHQQPPQVPRPPTSGWVQAMPTNHQPQQFNHQPLIHLSQPIMMQPQQHP
ncbi:hypothetical protein BLA29_009164 [Euroglyphus maynei]|uniref:Uncharacterized protein n=1 Tax=Euroglyphus maynei TaxID=6958 RepID=A0A1Y3B5L5_EURMA|nr:hypothetical protein BLA29_009164 [Euroglyphus maynei]